MTDLPALFKQRLRDILPPEVYPAGLESFASENPCSVRVNTLKTSAEQVRASLQAQGISFRPVDWYPQALVLDRNSSILPRDLDVVSTGCLYIQGLSSMLVVLLLGPQPGERILDMCAAPGSKATHMAMMMRNEGELICLENVRKRFYKLKAVASLTGAAMIRCLCLDGRRYRSRELFDRILIDAPCSSEGRFKTASPKSYDYWSERKIKEMAKKQKGLLLNASRYLKPGGVLVYSTCTFAPEENEGVIDFFLKKAQGYEIEPIQLPGIKTTPPLNQWRGTAFDPRINSCCRILPVEGMETFFIAKLRKQ